MPGSLEGEAMTMTGNDDAERKFWFNLTTGQVEEGQQSSWEHVMGPYATREEAARALDIAKQRNQDWEEDDREWNRED
jgi:hypothetical protein